MGRLRAAGTRDALLSDMRSTLILFVSRRGQTRKIAERLAAKLELLGVSSRLHDLDRGDPPRQHVEAAEGLIVGAPLFAGRYPRPIARFVDRHLSVLSSRPSAFFSVSLCVASPGDTGLRQAADCITPLLERTRWKPDYIARFGGGLAYTRYNPLLRAFMRRISRANRGPIDTTRDFELTDWAAVDELARDFAAQARNGRFVPARLHPETSRLDSLMPRFDHRMVQQAFVPLARERAFAALGKIRAEDMPLATWLARVRTLGSPHDEPPGEEFRDSAARFGVVAMPAEEGRELLGGLVGRFWRRDFGIRHLASAGEFARFDEPGYTKVLTSFYFEDTVGGTWVRAETRILSTSEDARRKFRWYWLALGAGIRLYMRSMLRALRRTAERVERSPLAA